MKKNILLLIGSCLFIFLIAEWVLRLSGRLPFIVNPEQKQFWEFDKELGWAHTPNQQGLFRKNDIQHQVSINSLGLRDDQHEYENHDSGGKKRILVLGDSFAWGFGVEHKDRFSEQIESQLNIEVINAGVSGYSTDQELLWYKKEGHKYDADAVIVLFCGNDESDNYKSRNYIIYNKPRFIQEYSKSGIQLYESAVERPKAIMRFHYAAMQRSSFYYQFVKIYEQILVPKFNIKNEWEKRRNADSNGELTRSILKNLSDIVKESDRQFIIVTTNSYWQEDRTFSYDQFVKMLKEDGHNVLDVSNAPGFNFDQMTLPSDQHWNEKGHYFVADLIVEQLDSTFKTNIEESISQ